MWSYKNTIYIYNKKIFFLRVAYGQISQKYKKKIIFYLKYRYIKIYVVF
jgi:hypothetical protein